MITDAPIHHEYKISEKPKMYQISLRSYAGKCFDNFDPSNVQGEILYIKECKDGIVILVQYPSLKQEDIEFYMQYPID